MANDLEKAQDRFISYICSICDDFGLNRFVAQLYGILYMADGPISLDELAKRSGSSKGNVSINIRELEKWGAVKKLWIKGSRKDYYEAELDIKKILSSKLKASAEKRISDVTRMLDEFKAIIKEKSGSFSEEEKRTAKLCEERLKRIEDLKKMASTALTFASKIL